MSKVVLESIHHVLGNISIKGFINKSNYIMRTSLSELVLEPIIVLSDVPKVIVEVTLRPLGTSISVGTSLSVGSLSIFEVMLLCLEEVQLLSRLRIPMVPIFALAKKVDLILIIRLLLLFFLYTLSNEFTHISLFLKEVVVNLKNLKFGIWKCSHDKVH
jgi:hypothetical protein